MEVEALVSSDTTQRLATPSAGATKCVKPRVSHQPRGSRYGKRIPGYSHPPNCNGQIRIWFHKSSWRSQTPMLKPGLTERYANLQQVFLALRRFDTLGRDVPPGRLVLRWQMLLD